MCHQEEKTTGRRAGRFADKLAQTQEAKGVQQLDSTTRKRDLTPKSTESPM